MKLKQLVLIIALIICATGVSAQTTDTKKDKNTPQQEGSMMDMMSKTLGHAFGDLEKDIDGTKDPFKGIENFEDFMNKGNLDPKTKATYWAMYELQAQEPSPKRRDSIRTVLDSLIRKDIQANSKINKN
ncbi:MAG: hypothetical protein AAF090_02220 [Bacteroidota bacterium]